MFSLFRPTVILFVSAVPEASIIETSSPNVGDAGRVTVMAPDVVFTKYPSPATAVKLDVFSVCQDVPAEISVVSPKLIDVPLNVKLELASLALAIEPANISFVTDVLGKVTVFEDKSKVDVSLAIVSIPLATSAALITPSVTFAEVTESSANPDVVTFVSAIFVLSITIYKLSWHIRYFDFCRSST